MYVRTHIGRYGVFGFAVAVLVPGAAVAQTFSTLAVPSELLTWTTVANSATVIPGGDGRMFNAFNQPSLNTSGLVVLRGRSKGSQGAGEPLRGIYSRDMGKNGPLTLVFDGSTVVPQPNNVTYQDVLGTFTEFPAFPRIGLDNATMITRAQSKPVWTYVLPDLTETRVGTSGIYAQPARSSPVTAEAQLGAVPGFAWFSVPGAPAGTKFDQFPGAPAVADASTVVFKGNYTVDLTSKTGIFFRDSKKAATPTQVIASSDTLIPGSSTVRFGSTAPPSASERDVVFLGLDIEAAPTMGGIYRAPLRSLPTLQPLVTIGQQVPGESTGMTFNKLGEGLSYDGQYVSFWGAWGTETRPMTLYCPVDGQKDVIAYCNQQYPAGMATDIPVHQGFFVYDLKSGLVVPVAKTGTEYLDMLFWVFSGRPPGVGDAESEDFEPPRWRASAFSAAYSSNKAAQVAFKARKQGFIPVDGIYLGTLAIDRNGATSAISILAETGSQGTLIDPMAPAGAKVTTVGIERDGLRDRWLAIAASMLDPLTSESWAGVYVTRLGRK